MVNLYVGIAALIFILLGLVGSINNMQYREKNYLNNDFKFKKRLRNAIVWNILTFIGLFIFTFYLKPIHQVSSNTNYSAIITILSLFTAGIVAGFFSFSYSSTDVDNISYARYIGISFTILFHLIFGSLSFFMGISKELDNVFVDFLLPIIMFFILVGNTCFDYWDFIKFMKKSEK